jgi:Fe-S-cluster containining protein
MFVQVCTTANTWPSGITLLIPMKTVNVYDLLHYILKNFYGVSCEQCPTICCVEIRRLAKLRKKYATTNPLRDVSKSVIIDGVRFAEEDVDYCPQLNRDTNRCTVYNERPPECRIYPFVIKSDDIFKVRNVGACVITDKFLERFMEFCSNFEQDYSRCLKLELGEKKYHNHLIIPFRLVVSYLHYEFSKHNMRIPFQEKNESCNLCSSK